MNKITERLLKAVSDWTGVPQNAAYNIREDGLCAGRQSTKNIEALEPYYGFRSLHHFKAKFNPRVDPVYLCFRDEADLPRIGLAIGRAFLPGATTRQLAALARSGGGSSDAIDV